LLKAKDDLEQWSPLMCISYSARKFKS